MIKVEGLKYKISNDEIIKGIDLEIEKGDCISIIGSSGCGKSTFLKLMSDLIPIEEGRILFEGKDYKEYKPLELRENIRYCIQLPCLFGDTVLENLEFPFKIRKLEVDKEKINELLKIVGLGEEICSKNINNISGGEKQRIALVRSFLFTPEVLLLDEATSALDIESAKKIESYIKELNKKGVTIVWVTHSIEQSKSIFNKRITMDSGRIVKMEVF